MSVPKAERWQAFAFDRTLGRYTMRVERIVGSEGECWGWSVRSDDGKCRAGIQGDEKKAKLAARRCVDGLLRAQESKS